MAEYRYRTTSMWCGWFGGWGSEGDISQHIQESADQGYRLVRTESQHAFWLWFVPRIKTLFIFEKEN